VGCFAPSPDGKEGAPILTHSGCLSTKYAISTRDSETRGCAKIGNLSDHSKQDLKTSGNLLRNLSLAFRLSFFFSLSLSLSPCLDLFIANMSVCGFVSLSIPIILFFGASLSLARKSLSLSLSLSLSPLRHFRSRCALILFLLLSPSLPVNLGHCATIAF